MACPYNKYCYLSFVFSVNKIEQYEDESEKEYRSSLVNFALQKINNEEMSTEEISDVTGISKSNIKVKLFRARQKMLEIIEKVEKKNFIYHE